MNIQHHPIFEVEKVATLYTEQDGVPVRYVCTSAPNKSATYAADIFYRETPHPEFGNRYFGLYQQNAFADNVQVMIVNADKIEDLTFEMAEVNGELHYSQHRHDYRGIGNGVAIDGGRDYFRATFANRDSFVRKTLRVENGKFVEVVL